MRERRRNYTAEFKESAVRLVTEQGYPVVKAARNLGINANMLRKWKSSIEEVETVNGEPVTRGEK
ncbi:MAG: transposase [Flexistipes sinusarabici]|uniref:Transposase n=1 Tax=Flexistipes sinusarabici TaxID=2352 RepID=A0A5D0MPT0_FLESI|nr:transposase [Flexistipes sinusarabici]TYB33560.1 MAG: transposase [Flexistipes sinusarabici]